VDGVDPAQARFLEFASAELDRAYRLAGLLLADASEAQDATQDALVRAWRSSGSLRDAASFQAWFDRILVNVCRDRLRRERRRRVHHGHP
jgi:RNA polymerase sigma-70 factor (ECF subfamily)